MNKTVIMLASLALLVAGCGDKDESGTSQVEESSETAEPAANDMAPGAAGEGMGKAGDADSAAGK